MLGAFAKDTYENSFESWNRPYISIQHFCTSYIQNYKIGTAPIEENSTVYGFCNIPNDNLTFASNTDVYSNTTPAFVSTAQDDLLYFSTPEDLVDKIGGYSEFDYRRLSDDGTKVQPDYIIVYRKNGVVNDISMDNANEVSRQFEEATGEALPILIVDIDACMNSQAEEINELIEEYSTNPSTELSDSIFEKLCAMKLTDKELFQNYNDTISSYLKIEASEINNMIEEYDKNPSTELLNSIYDRLLRIKRYEICDKFVQDYGIDESSICQALADEINEDFEEFKQNPSPSGGAKLGDKILLCESLFNDFNSKCKIDWKLISYWAKKN